MVPQTQKTQGAAIAYAPAVEPSPPPTPLHAESPLKSPDAAHYLGMSESWLRQSRMSGRMSRPPPWHSFGRAVRYFRRELDSWIENRVPSGEQGKSASRTFTTELARARDRDRPELRQVRQRRAPGTPHKVTAGGVRRG
jgi:predicted DNA-binding transcriptional regulator AlpA